MPVPMNCSDRRIDPHRRQHFIQQLLAIAQRPLRGVLAVDPEDVEDLVDHRGALAKLAQRRLVAHVHSRLQPLEARSTALVERDDLAVEDRLIRAGQRLGHAVGLGVLARAVEQIARLKARDPAIDERDRADAVPLRLEREVR
jgi:hypothetical protein